MKKLPTPTIDDDIATTETANNTRLHKTSYPHLQHALTAVLLRYQEYRNACGDAYSIAGSTTAGQLKSGLLNNYAAPPKSLSFINDLRGSSPDVCPMCGSLKTSTLDHILPKEDFPEFAVLSRNLVPACDCNSKRGKALKGNGPHVRVFHPYYDNCLTFRLLSCEFTPNPSFPLAKVALRYLTPNRGININSLKFHAEKIIIPSGIIGWLTRKWTSINVKPNSVIQTLPWNKECDSAEMKESLRQAFLRCDQAYGTPNNWESILFHGLHESTDIIDWLVVKHNESLSHP